MKTRNGRPSRMRPSRLPIFISALVCPGIGQFLQRRWLAGAIFTALFLAFFLSVVYNALAPIFRILRQLTDPSGGSAALTAPNLGKLLTSFALAMITYAISLFDAYKAYRRSCRRWAEERFKQKMQGIAGDQLQDSRILKSS